MLVDLKVFYLGHLKNLYTIQYNTIQLQTVSDACLRRTCLLDTSALSALEIL